VGDVAEDLFAGGVAFDSPIPANCDLFPLTDELADRIAARAPDGGLQIGVVAHREGKRQSIPGRHPIEHCSIAWLGSSFGAGTYDVTLFDLRGQILTTKRHSVGGQQGYPAPASPGFPGQPPGYPPPGFPPVGYQPPFPGAPGPHGPGLAQAPPYGFPPAGYGYPPPYGYQPPFPGYGYPQQQPPARKEESLDAIVGKLGKLAAIRTAERLADVKEKEHHDGPSERLALANAKHQNDMQALLMKAVMRGGNKKDAASGGMGEMLQMFKFVSFLNAQKGKEVDESMWREVLPGLVQDVAPAVVALVAGILPPEQAAKAMDIMESINKVREAEAKNPGPVETEGTEV